MQFSTNSEIYDSARPWQYRVIRASLATTIGTVVRAMLAKQTNAWPEFGSTCEITAEGMVVTEMRYRGRIKAGVCIGSVVGLRDDMRRLADHCKLSDAERLELFEELRKWVRKDHRAASSLES